MIIVSGTIPIHTDKREEALGVIRPMVEKTRAEEGNSAYRFMADLDDEGVVHLHEMWDSEEAMAAHMAAAHFTDFMQQVAPFVAGAPDIRRYDVTAERALF